MTAGKYATGCPAIAESHRLDPRPGTLFTLATCESEWGHIATAVTRYGDYLALFDTLPDDKRAVQGERPKVARETRDRLLPQVPQLTLKLPPGAPEGTTVQRNGELIAPVSLGIALPVDPGEYVLTTTPPGGAPHEQRISIAKGESKVVLVELTAPGPSATTTAPIAGSPSPGPSSRRIATYVVGGAGIASLIAGGVLGGLTAGQKGTIDQHCGAGIGSSDELACDQVGLDAAKSAQGLGLGSTVALAVGGAALGAAVVLFLTEPRPAPASGAAPAKAGSPHPARASGPWIAAGVLSAGPGGARIGLEGTW
ncbi:MAG: hypothetical protein R3F14_17105 [Polyangiaceae bacterium]